MSGPDYWLSRPLENPRLVTAGFGMGVQSTTMLLMAKHGEIRPMPDAAIVSDTQVEPMEVYDHLRFMQSPNIALPFPVDVTTKGHLGKDVLGSAEAWAEIGGKHAPRSMWKTASRIATPPFFTRGPRIVSKTVELEPLPLLGIDGGEVEIVIERHTERETFGMLGRKCTREYKIEPIVAEIRRRLGLPKGARGPKEPVAEHWIGLTTDELERVSWASPSFIHHRWPLIEMGMSRGDCIEWLRRKGYPIPPKSRCIFCPYQSDELWMEMKTKAPWDFEEACRYDRAIRNGVRGALCELYLHESRTPLETVDFTEPPGIWSHEGFRNECQGVCGI